MHLLETTPDRLATLQEQPHAIPRSDIVLRVEGPGAVSCLQGLFTNDIERAGTESLLWGAVLTPKGMIITDCWMRRRDDTVLVIVPASGIDAVADLFRRSLPPRLAKVTNLADSMRTWWLTAGDAASTAPGEVVVPTGSAPFAAMLLTDATVDAATLQAAGWHAASPEAADILALLAGWPVHGREIDERTLIQEVRFDELEGVRYDKGCYVGQETVARLHFRGHPNRMLRAIEGTGESPVDAVVTHGDGREVGTVATLLRLGSRWLASAKLRREVVAGDRVSVGGRVGVVTEFREVA